MQARITPSELGRDLASILDRVRRRGDSFVIEEEGEAVAVLGPIMGMATWSSLAEALRGVPRPDSAFATDLEEIQRHQPDVPEDEWPS